MLLPTRSPTVVVQPLEEGAVLFCTKSEVYFGLNEVGQIIWESLPPAGRSFTELEALLVERYPSVEIAELRQDAAQFLQALEDAGLVRHADGEPETPPPR